MPSGSTWRIASSMRSRSLGRPRRASRRYRRSGCGALSALFKGEFLDGLQIDRNPAFNGWLTAQRRRYRSCHAALLEHLVGSRSGDEVFGYLEKWLELAPFDPRVHERLLNAFARRGRIREGEEHLAATARLFEAEGLDVAPIREAWRAARAQRDGAAKARAAALPPTVAATAACERSSVMAASRRASIAVMPFVDRTADKPVRGGPAGGLAYDVITQARQAAEPVRHCPRHRLRARASGASARKRPAGC